MLTAKHTSMNSITDLKNKHSGQDIYILCAGGSMDYIDSSFFDNKITIGLNRVGKFFKCDYLISKDSIGFGNILKNSLGNPKILISKYETGDPGRRLNYIDSPSAYVFDHFDKPNQEPRTNLISTQDSRLVVSFSTVTTGLHAAAFMGSKNIILCGHDCGVLDGKTALSGYHKDLPPHHGSEEAYARWLSLISSHTVEVRDKLKEVYGCNIVSINPFINFSLEGHQYR